MTNWVCGHWPKSEEGACGRPAEWYASFRVGAWLSHVPLCSEHVRSLHLLTECLKAGPGVAMEVAIELMREIHSTSSTDQYQPGKLLWKCSECGLPIVRSLESGEWIVAGSTLLREAVQSQLAELHEHRPG